ncbi:MAG TPA: ATP-binding protein, partial [Anaerolineales bacterium]|nr:ATP-binding protein [Anaerolineales bacterium]
MTLPDGDNQEEPADANVQNISGENIVASIHAEGSAQVTIHQVSYNRLSEVEEERARQKAELDVLQKAIAQKYFDLDRLVDTSAPAVGNPYLFLQPFGFTDRARFFGREDEIAELFERVTNSAITFLSGNSGTGKTSLL